MRFYAKIVCLVFSAILAGCVLYSCIVWIKLRTICSAYGVTAIDPNGNQLFSGEIRIIPGRTHFGFWPRFPWLVAYCNDATIESSLSSTRFWNQAMAGASQPMPIQIPKIKSYYIDSSGEFQFFVNRLHWDNGIWIELHGGQGEFAGTISHKTQDSRGDIGNCKISALK